MPSQTSGGKGTNSMTEQRPPYKTNAPVPRAFSIKVYPTRVHLGFIGPAGAVEISYARTPLDSLAKTVEKYSLSLTTQHEGYPKESRYIIFHAGHHNLADRRTGLYSDAPFSYHSLRRLMRLVRRRATDAMEGSPLQAEANSILNQAIGHFCLPEGFERGARE